MELLRRLFRRRNRADPGDPVELVLYTRPGCHLCDEMKAELERARSRVRRPFRIREVDIESDEALEERYGQSIPVLEIAGSAAFKGRLTAEDFERKLEQRLGKRG